MNCKFCGGHIVNYLAAHEYKIMKCGNCEISFTDPPPILPEYEILDFHSGHTSEKVQTVKELENLPLQWQALINKQVEFLTKHLTKDHIVLEIGCGEGLLLQEIKKKGLKVKGIEPSKEASKRARLRNLNVTEGYFNKDAFNEKFDAIVLSHVLEHIEEPEKIIEAIKEVLNPGGFLLLTQTNYKGIVPKLQKQNWYAWVPEQHFWHFTASGLVSWLNKYGFKKVQIAYQSLVHPPSKKIQLINIFNALIKSSNDQYSILFKFEE